MALTHPICFVQSFAERLFARLQKANERLETRLAMMAVISRAVGVHRLLLLNFYPFLQKYIQPHQRDVTRILAILIQVLHTSRCFNPGALQWTSYSYKPSVCACLQRHSQPHQAERHTHVHPGPMPQASVRCPCAEICAEFWHFALLKATCLSCVVASSTCCPETSSHAKKTLRTDHDMNEHPMCALHSGLQGPKEKHAHRSIVRCESSYLWALAAHYMRLVQTVELHSSIDMALEMPRSELLDMAIPAGPHRRTTWMVSHKQCCLRQLEDHAVLCA